MYTVNEIKALLNERLGKKRLKHSLNVADECARLAEIYGEDEDKAYLAGLVHDICKEIPQEEQLAMTQRSKRNVEACEVSTPALRHAIAGAYYAQAVVGIDDDDILNAVRYHTIAHENMSTLEKILYMADLTCADRDYKDVGRFRRLVNQSLDEAIYEALKFYIPDTIKKDGFITLHTVKAYNFYLNAVQCASDAEDNNGGEEKKRKVVKKR